MSQWLRYGRNFKGWEEKHKNVWSRCNKSSRGFTVYQKCDLEDILLLKDNSDEYYTANNFPPLIVKAETLEQLVNFKWDQVSSQLQSIILGWEYQVFDLDQIFWSARNPIEYLSKNPSWYIAEPFGSSSVENTSLLHIPVKWLISTDYYQKITLLTWRSCQMNVTAKVYYSSFYLSRRNGDGMGNPVTLRYPRGPDSSMVEHLVQFQKGLGLSPGPVTFHAAIGSYDSKVLPRRPHAPLLD